MRTLDKPVKEMYKIYLENWYDDSIFTEVYNKAEKKFKVTLLEFKQVYVNINRCTIVNKLRDFQYRLLTNAIHANDRLFHWKITDTQLCERCASEKQTTQHLFYFCNKVCKIWKEFQQFVEECMYCDTSVIEINVTNTFLNLIHLKSSHLVNFFALIIKQHIYFCKCSNKQLRFQDIVLKFEEYYHIEKSLAQQKNKMGKHHAKWEPYTGPITKDLQSLSNSMINNKIIEYISSHM